MKKDSIHVYPNGVEIVRHNSRLKIYDGSEETFVFDFSTFVGDKLKTGIIKKNRGISNLKFRLRKETVDMMIFALLKFKENDKSK